MIGGNSMLRISHWMRPPLRRNALAVGLGLALSMGAGDGLAASPPAGRSAAPGDLDQPKVSRTQAVRPHRADQARGESTLGGVSHVVTNCNDAGAGSLREALALAAVGDTIDMTALTCSVITLTTGALVNNVDDITIKGSGRDELTIDGGSELGYQNHVLLNFGEELTISSLTIANARYATSGAFPTGGCIYSSGALEIKYSDLRNCHVSNSGSQTAKGGAIYAKDGLRMKYSTVRESSVVSVSGTSGAKGGGVYAKGFFEYYSAAGLFGSNITISDNIAYSASGSALGGGIYADGLDIGDSTISNNQASVGIDPLAFGTGGGIFALAPIRISSSTIASNTAEDNIGGVALKTTTTQSRVFSSTISGNSTLTGVIGGLYTFGDTLVTNSTVAFNQSVSASGCSGIEFEGNLELTSSIVTNNLAGGTAADLCYFSSGAVTGSRSMVMAPDPALTLPSNFLLAIDPQLHYLADNGGPTMTHAIAYDSPAIDNGSNAHDLLYDQRGSTTRDAFQRENLISGFLAYSATDIGAFEYGFPDIDTDPAELDFGPVIAGNTSSIMTAHVFNPAVSMLKVSDVALSAGPFQLVGGTCGSVPFRVVPQESCTLEFTFTPTDAGSATGAAVVSSNGGAEGIVLQGVGQQGELAIPNVTWVDVDADGIPFWVIVNLGNSGDAPVTVTAIEAATAPFLTADIDCGAVPFTLNPGETCQVQFGFAPTEGGEYFQEQTWSTNAGDKFVDLAGNAVEGMIDVAPPVLNFHAVMVGESSGVLQATLSNSGDGTLHVSSIPAPAAPFIAAGGTCSAAPFALPPGSNCTLEYVFAPSMPGGAKQTLVIVSDGGNEDISLIGQGTASDVIFADGFELP